jgi:hypothetical protein
VVSQINIKRQNILHECAEGKLEPLLAEVCLEAKLDCRIVRAALDIPNANGLKPLQLCSHEKTILKIMDMFPDFDIDNVDKKGNNWIHVYAKKNFVGCLKRILKSLKDEHALNRMLCQKNNNGNNPLMSCVFKNSNDALNFLLWTVFTLDDEEEDWKHMRGILHDKNTKGDALLGLLLHYQKKGSMSESIALQMEKKCHTEAESKDATMKNLTNCLKKHVEPSSNVLCAVQEVEESFETTSWIQLGSIWIQLFFQSFLMPLGIMLSDMSFDVILVIGYAYCLWTMDTQCDPPTFEDLCSGLGSSRNHTAKVISLEKINREIPSKLAVKPRFFYSLAFIVLPWFFYCIEFCHSRHLTNTIHTVNLHLYMAYVIEKKTFRNSIVKGRC